MKARVRYNGTLDDVVRWGDIKMFQPDGSQFWWDKEYAKGRMWFPGAVQACYSPGQAGQAFNFVLVDKDDYVTRDASGQLYVWRPRDFHEVYELVGG